MKLACGEGALQLLLQLKTAAQGYAELRQKSLVRVAAGTLGLIHGQIGVAHQQPREFSL